MALNQNQAEAAANFLADVMEVLEGTGRHALHERKQVGRCVFCSCGIRAQGKMVVRESE